MFVGGFTVDAAEAVAGAMADLESDVVDGVSRLLDQSLLRRMDDTTSGAVETRFGMLETVREYGLERLREAGEEDAACAAHAGWCLARAEVAELHLFGHRHDQGRWMARIDAELGNVRGAINWLLATGEATKALRLATALEGYWDARSFDAEVRHWVETALAASRDAPVALRISALYGLILRTALLGDIRASVACGEAALVIAATATDPFILGLAHFGAGLAWGYDEDPVRAAAAFSAAVPHFRQTDRLDYLAVALAKLGDELHQLGYLADAVALLDEALACYDRVNDSFGHSLSLGQRAELACTQGDHVLAVRLFSDAIAEARAIGDERVIMGTVVGLAEVALATDQNERAARLLGAVTAAQDEAGTLQLYNGRRIERTTAAVRDALGESAFTAAWSVGRAMAWPEAVADALAILSHPMTPAPSLLVLDHDPALTHCEVEVLRLVANGHSDQEIAGALCISRHIAKTHVGTILNKLGLDSRAAAAAFAARDGLV